MCVYVCTDIRERLDHHLLPARYGLCALLPPSGPPPVVSGLGLPCDVIEACQQGLLTGLPQAQQDLDLLFRCAAASQPIRDMCMSSCMMNYLLYLPAVLAEGACAQGAADEDEPQIEERIHTCFSPRPSTESGRQEG
jgi:hypothetical protein